MGILESPLFNKSNLSLLARALAVVAQAIYVTRHQETSMTYKLKTIEAALNKSATALIAVAEKATAIRNKELSALADKFRTAGVTKEDLGGNAKSNPLRGAVKAFFDRLAESGVIAKSSAATYGTCFWIGFEQSVPFSTDLANQKSAEKKTANTGTGKKAADAAKVKGSIVVTASRDNLQSLLMQTIKMARDLSLAMLADELIESGRSADLLPKSFK